MAYTRAEALRSSETLDYQFPLNSVIPANSFGTGAELGAFPGDVGPVCVPHGTKSISLRRGIPPRVPRREKRSLLRFSNTCDAHAKPKDGTKKGSYPYTWRPAAVMSMTRRESNMFRRFSRTVQGGTGHNTRCCALPATEP
jgi:hypothetical protein